MNLLVTGDSGDVNMKDDDGMTPLHWAARNNHLPVAEYLITEVREIVT